MQGMRVVKGKVVGNTVVTDEPVPEGTAVDVVIHDAPESEEFPLTDELREELRAASASARRGEVVEMDDLLAEIDALR